MYISSKKEGELNSHREIDEGNKSLFENDASKAPGCRFRELLALAEAIPNGINFDQVNKLALECVDDIFENWLPDGDYQGIQYVPLNPTRDDKSPGSFQINSETGLWQDFATGDKGGDLVSLVHYLEGCSQSQAAIRLLKFIAGQSERNSSVQRRPVTRKAKDATKSTRTTPIFPVPASAKPLPSHFPHLGTPSMRWEYRDATGRLTLYMLRFDTETVETDAVSGETKTKRAKTYRPVLYCRDDSGWEYWSLQGCPAPRPAYGIDRLAANANSPVLFAEGEKSADAAQRLFPRMVAVTTMHGAKSPEKTDFGPFKGRKVYIAPDNDKAGFDYRDKLVELLVAAGAEVVGVMRLELLQKDGHALANGYDLADAEEDGWSAEAFAEIGDSLWEPVQLQGSACDSLLPEESASSVAANPAAQGGNKKKLPLQLVREFADQSHGGHIATFDNQILAYQDGYWAVLDQEADVKRPILKLIGETATANQVRGVFDLLKIEFAVKSDRLERKSPLICLHNGTLDPAKNKLHQHAVEHYLTNKLDIQYDPAATAPLWLQTLDEIFAPDEDRVQKIQLLQEFIGYCLIPDTRMHKFLWLVGAGGNGKSLILAIITALVGKPNISYAAIERLQEKFVRAELQGKLVNISSEMSAQATVADGYLKQITAGDEIEAERKHEKPFSFKPYARLIGATNSLPRLLDHSDGFHRRAIIVRFNRQFRAEEIDIHREAKLMAELPGILNWAVAGLQRLLERGSFVPPPSSVAEVEQYRVNSDPVRQFVDEFVTPTENKELWVSSSALYEYYKEWNSKNGYKQLAQNQFSERLQAVGLVKGRDRSLRYWKAQYRQAVLDLPPSISPSGAKYVV